MKKALIQLHTAVFLAGFTAILGKLITLNEGLLVWYRFFITVVTLLVLLYFRKKLQIIPLKSALNIFAAGAVVAIHWVTFYGSVKYANASVALVCFSATGFFTAFIEPLILKRPINWVEILLGLLTITGVYIIFDFYPQYKMGIVFGLISALGSTIFPVLNKKLLAKHQPQTVMLYEMGGGLLTLSLLIPLYLQFFPASNYLPTATDWLWLLALGWLCTVFSFELQLKALQKISAFTANLTYNLEPVYGIIMAFVFFKEHQQFTGHFYIGTGLILLAVLIQMARVLRQRNKPV